MIRFVLTVRPWHWAAVLIFYCAGAVSLSSQTVSSRTSDEPSDVYRLVFASHYDGRIKWKYGQYDGMVKSQEKSFLQNLNAVGKENYRLLSALLNHPVALVRKDESEFIYDLFETISVSHLKKNRLDEEIRKRKALDFRLAEHAQVKKLCNVKYDPEVTANLEKCEYRDVFLVEKASNRIRGAEQVLINAYPGWGARPSDQFEEEIVKNLNSGFYPVAAISPFELLLQKVDEKESLGEEIEIQVLRSSWGTSNVESKVNLLAGQGYRLALVTNGIAVLYRTPETAKVRASYVWLRADTKSFESRLAALGKKGAVFKTTYPDSDGLRNQLIFEIRESTAGRQTEFRTFNYEFKKTEDRVQNRVNIDLTPASRISLQRMNELAKNGFVARELFEGKTLSVIMENSIR